MEQIVVGTPFLMKGSGGKIIVYTLDKRDMIFKPQDWWGDVSNLITGGVSAAQNTISSAVSSVQQAGTGAISAAQSTISTALAAAQQQASEAAVSAATEAASIATQLAQVNLGGIASSIPSVSLSEISLPSLSDLDTALASISPITSVSATEITSDIDISGGVSETPSVETSSILESIGSALSGSLSSLQNVVASSAIGTIGGLSSALSSLETIPSTISEITSPAVTAITEAATSEPAQTVEKLGVDIGITGLAGLVSTPGTLVDIGVALGNQISTGGISLTKSLIYGLPIGSVYVAPAIEQTTLGETIQKGVVEGIETLTGYEANTSPLTGLVEGSSINLLQSENIGERALGAGGLAVAGFGDWVLQNPVLNTSGGGQLLQIVSGQQGSILEVVKGLGTLTNLVLTGKTGTTESAGAGSEQEGTVSEGTLVQTYTYNPDLTATDNQSTVTPGAGMTVYVQVPTGNKSCDGLLVGSSEAAATGC